MTVTSKLRGHAIATTGGTTDMSGWRYVDDDTPVLGNERPCTRCGRLPVVVPGSASGWGADACLGVLPGVKAACCGHGEPERAYVLFDDGTSLSGDLAERWLETMRPQDGDTPYRPTGGTEGADFEDAMCGSGCDHYRLVERIGTWDCELGILTAAFVYQAVEPEYPRQWVRRDGKPLCIARRQVQS